MIEIKLNLNLLWGESVSLKCTVFQYVDIVYFPLCKFIMFYITLCGFADAFFVRCIPRSYFDGIINDIFKIFLYNCGWLKNIIN